MADNETSVSWRFDADKCFSIICANGCVMICTIWTKTGDSWSNLTSLIIHSLHKDNTRKWAPNRVPIFTLFWQKSGFIWHQNPLRMSQDGSENQPTRAKIANIIFSEKMRFDLFFLQGIWNTRHHDHALIQIRRSPKWLQNQCSSHPKNEQFWGTFFVTS